MGDTPQSNPESFWKTIPGVITAVAALITAIGGLLVALHAVSQNSSVATSGSEPKAIKSPIAPGSDSEIKQDLITVHPTAGAKFSRAPPDSGFTFEVEYFYQITNANPHDVDCRVEFTCIKEENNSTNARERYQSRTHSIFLKAGATEDITGILRCNGYNDKYGRIALRQDSVHCSGT